MPTKKETAEDEEEISAEAQRTNIVMFGLVDAENNTISAAMRPLFIKDNKIPPAQDRGASGPPESAFHSDLFLPMEQGTHACKWQNGVRVCPTH